MATSATLYDSPADLVRAAQKLRIGDALEAQLPYVEGYAPSPAAIALMLKIAGVVGVSVEILEPNTKQPIIRLTSYDAANSTIV